MRTNTFNLLILADNALVAHGLRHHLNECFNGALNIRCYSDVKSLLKHAESDTNAVVLDYYVEGQKGTDLLRSLRAISPGVRGIFHSCENDVVNSIRTLLKGESIAPAPAYSFKLDEQYGHYYARL